MADLPIMMDSRIGDSLIRCNYLCIENDRPKGGWSIGIGGLSMPFFMLGLLGIIYRPFGGQEFDSPTQIDELYQRIEDGAGLSISVEDVWLPNFLFLRTPTMGDVYRVNDDLFASAILWRQGRLSERQLIEQSEFLFPNLRCRYSERETPTFREWVKKQMFIAHERFPKNHDFKLQQISEHKQ